MGHRLPGSWPVGDSERLVPQGPPHDWSASSSSAKLQSVHASVQSRHAHLLPKDAIAAPGPLVVRQIELGALPDQLARLHQGHLLHARPPCNSWPARRAPHEDSQANRVIKELEETL